MYLNTSAMSWVANWRPFSTRLKELNTQDRKEIESLTTQLTKEQSSVSELTKLKDSLEEELEEHENMVGELTEQVSYLYHLSLGLNLGFSSSVTGPLFIFQRSNLQILVVLRLWFSDFHTFEIKTNLPYYRPNNSSWSKPLYYTGGMLYRSGDDGREAHRN